MNSTAFPHLHLHTNMSLLDGLGTIENLMDHASAIGTRTMAVTDHGTLSGAVIFSIEAQKRGIKPILGLEAYVEFDNEIGHMTFLADGDKGWNSLLRLNTLGHESSFNKPAVTIDQILKNADGLICLSGCIASPFHRLSFNEAKSLGVKFKRAFGSRFFAEHMFIGESDAFTRPSALAKDLGILGVVTNDAHFPAFEQADLHPILMQMRSGFCYNSEELYVKNWNQMQYAIKKAGWTEAQAQTIMERTVKVGDLLKPVSLKNDPQLPYLGTTLTQMADAARQSQRGYRLLRPGNEYDKRIEYELGVVSDMKFLDYFTILKDVVDYAEKENVRVGPGRGSGAGSLLLYFLGITHIDPIEHGLKFERFLNPLRVSMPDVDIDFESERREKVLDYVETKYNARQIATFSRYSHKSLIRDLGRHFRIPKDVIEKLTEESTSSPVFKKAAQKYPLFEESYNAFLGQVRHRGKHAGGVIVTNTPVPIERAGKQLVAAWSEGSSTDLSYAGIVKFDFLAISILTALRRLEEKHGKRAEEPYPNSPVFDLFKNGNLSGVFQFAGSQGIRDLTVRLQPSTFEELIVINALYRPGALSSGATNKYPTNVSVPKPYENVLRETHGSIVYQEQVMEIYRITVDGTLAEADSVRKIIAKPKPDDKKWVAELARIKDEFYMGCRHNLKFGKRLANHWWNELRAHSSYSFNKSHAAAYSYISWECAWWKFNHPGDFYAEMLNIDPDKQQDYVSEAIQMGLSVTPPNVETSQAIKWTYDEKTNAIYMPLKSIKFMGERGAAYIEQERDKNGRFITIENFMQRIPKKVVQGRARTGLWYLNGFSSLSAGKMNDKEIEKCLGIKIESMSKKAAQLNFLGFVIPTTKQLQKSEELTKLGYKCGTITKVEERKGKRGPYHVVHIAPFHAFWTPGACPVPGVFIAVKMGKRGKAEEIKIIK